MLFTVPFVFILFILF